MADLSLKRPNIPHVIHYCWFGGKQLPESARRCIESWKKYCPDYEIKEWNDGNYDISASAYCEEAYNAKKWAFASDYARFDILYRYGGIYFDTDVELIQPIDDIADNGAFMACESSTTASNGEKVIAVAPGLGVGAEKGNPLFGKVVDYYEGLHFAHSKEQKTVVEHITGFLSQSGYTPSDSIQHVDSVTIYPPEYFCPLDNMTGELTITKNTRAIHHYDGTWMNESARKSIMISRKFTNKGKLLRTFGTVLSLPFRLANRIKNDGIKNTINHLHSNL